MMLRPFRNDLIVDIFHDTWFYQYFSGSEVLRWCGVFIYFYNDDTNKLGADLCM